MTLLPHNIQHLKWIDLFNKYGNDYSHTKTEDLSKQFFYLAARLGSLIEMHKGSNHTGDEIQKLRNYIQSDLGVLYKDLRLYGEECGEPDELTKSALSHLHDHEQFFK